MTNITESVLKRFFDSIFYSPCGCWLWMGNSNFGYGLITVEKKNVRTHRLSYEIHKGDIGDGLMVCHSCDNRLCVNPDHLWLGTALDNNMDREAKGRNRYNIGCKNQASKLTEIQVVRIRELYMNTDITQRNLGTMFSVSQYAIRCIVNRRTWKHV